MDELQKILEQIEALKLDQRNTATANKEETDAKLEGLEKRFAEVLSQIEKMDQRAVEDNRMEGTSPVEGVEDGEYRSAFEGYLATGSDLEVRGLGGADHAEGGALVPLDFETQLVERINEENVLRAKVKVRQTSRDKVFLPKSEGVAVAWGKNNPNKSKIATGGMYLDIVPAKALTTVDQDTIDDAAVDVPAVVADDMVPAFAEAEQDKWINGTGSDEPMGLLKTTALTSGAIKSGVADGLPATDEEIIALLASLRFGVPSAVRKKSGWTLNSATMARLFTVKDTDGEKLIKNNKMFGTDEILVIESMPNIEAGKYPIAYGDWGHYHVRDRQGLRIKVITGGDWDANGERGYLGTKRQGGGLANTKAFKLLKIAA